MLPVRVGVRATRLWLRAAEETVNVAASTTSRIVGLAATRSGEGNRGTATSGPQRVPEGGPPAEPTSPAPSRAERDGRDAEADSRSAKPDGHNNGARDSSATRTPSAPAEAERVAAPEPADSPAEPEPVHVSEEPALVEEFAEPGAEDGAGAEIHIEAPWEGYGRMNAKEIVSRLGESTPAQLAAVQLYESTHRQRQTILNAVQRELRGANGRSG